MQPLLHTQSINSRCVCTLVLFVLFHSADMAMYIDSYIRTYVHSLLPERLPGNLCFRYSSYVCTHIHVYIRTCVYTYVCVGTWYTKDVAYLSRPFLPQAPELGGQGVVYESLLISCMYIHTYITHGSSITYVHT